MNAEKPGKSANGNEGYLVGGYVSSQGNWEAEQKQYQWECRKGPDLKEN